MTGAISRMIEAGQTNCSGELVCAGWGMGSGGEFKCGLTLRYRVTVDYKEVEKMQSRSGDFQDIAIKRFFDVKTYGQYGSAAHDLVVVFSDSLPKEWFDFFAKAYNQLGHALGEDVHLPRQLGATHKYSELSPEESMDMVVTIHFDGTGASDKTVESLMKAPEKANAEYRHHVKQEKEKELKKTEAKAAEDAKQAEEDQQVKGWINSLNSRIK